MLRMNRLPTNRQALPITVRFTAKKNESMPRARPAVAQAARVERLYKVDRRMVVDECLRDPWVTNRLSYSQGRQGRVSSGMLKYLNNSCRAIALTAAPELQPRGASSSIAAFSPPSALTVFSLLVQDRDISARIAASDIASTRISIGFEEDLPIHF